MAALQPLKFLTVQPIAKHTATVIFVHGLGDTGFGWKPVAEMFKADSTLNHIKWVLPHAPTMRVTANMGMEMPSWFDIYDFGFQSTEDETRILHTVHSLNQIITAEVDAGIPANRIVLGGFSQGGAVTIFTGLTSERKLAGLAVLSGWTPLANKLKAMATPSMKSVPIFWGHGKADPLVKFRFAQHSVDFLHNDLAISSASPDVPEKGGLTFHAYDDLPHMTNEEELRDLSAWLRRILPKE
ncbi:Phospholipase/carboxylesterase [Sparassis latifolia]|uniref:Acyl-protein thioesterase 1 n=1 Tax=Sparassis crispa TaxID=139825 RepID=A0A401GD72_9APHY|nr:Acyl-protein thioesterase 1 [Sparassis crispa]GBE80112.1 Acyl-protein thioesterase 1 [Sparassis crispa]